MYLHGRIEVCTIGDGVEAPPPANVICEFPAQEIVEMAPRQPRKEVVRQFAERLAGCQRPIAPYAADGPLWSRNDVLPPH